jgi:hypothetical protein
MMRFALVVFFFLGLFFALRTTPPPEIESRTAQIAAAPPEQRPPAPPPVALSPPPSTAPSVLAPPSEPSPDDAPEDAQIAETIVESGEADRPGEERTSIRKAQQLPLTPEEIDTGIQKELTRLACFSGRPERGFGRKGRAALRRFASRAKPKEPSAPTEAMLRLLRNYPANYCKLCRPGQPACKIEVPAQKRSDLNIPREQTSASFSTYLPPWMTGEQIARAAAEEDARLPFPDVEQSARPEGIEPDPPRPRARRRSAKRSRYVGERGREKQPRRRSSSSWPTINGWPSGR